MELAKDNLDPATQRDIRDTQAIMLAGFELCFSILDAILKKHGIDPKEIEADPALTSGRRLYFEKYLNEARVRFFSSPD